MKRAVLLFGVVVLCLAGPAVASSPPEPICGPCGSSFEEVSDRQGVPVNVTHSTAEVRVDENGSATWIVTTRLDESSASALASNPERLTPIAREAAVGDGLAADSAGSVTVQSATVDNDTVRIRFVDPDAGSRHAGVLVVDYFHAAGGSPGWVLNADRVSITGPESAVVGNDLRAIIDDRYASDDMLPTVSGGTLTWERTANDDSEATIHDEFYIAYTEPEVGSTRVDAALALASLPIWLSNVRDIVLPAAVVYGLVLIGVVAGTRRMAVPPTGVGQLSTDIDRLPTDVDQLLPDTGRLPTGVDRLAAGIAGVGLGVGVLTAFSVLPATLVGFGTVYLVVGGAAAVRPGLLASVRGALAVGLAATLAVGGVLLGLGAVDPRFTDLAPTVVHAMAIHLPLAVSPAFGVGVTRDGATARWSTVAAVGGAVAAFVVAGSVFVPFDSRPFFLILFVLLPATALVGLLVLPLSVLAAGLSEPRETTA